MLKKITVTAALMAAMAASAAVSRAQYPTIPPDVQAQAQRKSAAMNQRSDEAWAKAQPAIEEWAKKGKPYIPWAAKPSDLPQAGIAAFPGAEGGGAYSFGGRGGRVYVVTTLQDGGPGSFREACEAGGPRIVVFNVSGIIHLKEKLRVRAPYITINGASAPGDGVCIAGDTVELETHDVIIRHMRFRRGQTWVGDRNDSIGGNPIGNIMIDHVSASWGLDECMSMYRHMWTPAPGQRELKLATVNITIQNSIFSEALNTYNHAFGSTIGGYNSTFHHNLWASNGGRNPSVGMNGDFSFVNNVLFNWVHRSVDGGDHLSYFNIINNYYKPGPATPKGQPIAWRILKPESQRGAQGVENFGRAYVAGNIVEGNERVTKDNWDGGVQPEARAPVQDVLAQVKMAQPFPMAKVTVMPAREAFDHVLAGSGATLPRRDAVDERIVQTVRTGQVQVTVDPTLAEELRRLGCPAVHIEKIVELAPRGIITKPEQVGGYPYYSGSPYQDGDSDGMPDAYETSHGLNPADASDASKDSGDGYTNIEKFLNGLTRSAF
jgi:hypothetical protein